jgi:hypothetical protein
MSVDSSREESDNSRKKDDLGEHGEQGRQVNAIERVFEEKDGPRLARLVGKENERNRSSKR